MGEQKINILLVEDNPGDAGLIQDLLSETQGSYFVVTHADRLSTGLELLATGRFDVLLLDLGLPDSGGFESFARAHMQAPEIPIVVLTGLDDKTLAVTAVREGAQDYLVKGHVERSLLERAIRYAIERKQIEEALRESESKIRGILSSMVDLVFVFDREARFIFYHSPSPSELYIPPEEFMGKKHSELMPPTINQLFGDAFLKNMKGETADFEYRLRIKSEPKWFSAKLSPLFHADEFKGAVAVIRDITEHKRTEEELQKHRDHLEDLVKERTEELKNANDQLRKEIDERIRAQEQIKASLNEKEILLKEIHHRVKNNLQIISSLLNLQARSVKDEKALELFKESQHRVRSMALIHDRLYRSGDLARIDFDLYIQKLTTSLFALYRVNPQAISLKKHVSAFLGIDTAIPCGLMINELVSNALKHAFTDGGKGEILITLHSNSDAETKENSNYTLRIRDNGIGLPKDIDFQNTPTLGLQLVCGLVKQLNGTIELDRSGGTAFTITFGELAHERRREE